MEAVGTVASIVTLVQTIGQIIRAVHTSRSKDKAAIINQLQDCLKKTWEETAKNQNWKDTTTPTEFTLNNQQNINETIQRLSNKLNELSPDDITCFMDNFIIKLGNYPKLNQYLNNAINMAKIRKILTQTSRPSPDGPDYVLTKGNSIKKDETIRGRDAFIDNLCKELCKPQEKGSRFIIQLTGMGGIGKSEILKRIYAEFANNLIKDHPFKHVGLLHYNNTLSNSLLEHITHLKRKTVDDAWVDMINLCNNEYTLLLIDDTRKQEATETPDDSFKNLFALNATVLIASRKQIHKMFTTYKVASLETKYCVEIFKENPHKHIHFPLQDTDDELLTDIIEKRAGCNPQLVRRLSAIAHEHNYSIVELNKELEKTGFAIRKDCEDEETLQEEINKLYPLSAISKDSEKSLLEAFALFPSDQSLDLTTCIQWLYKDANIEERDCRLGLKKLANSTWLQETEKGYSMHQLVQTAVLTQSENIVFDKHRNLINHLLTAVSWGVGGTFEKAIPYIGYAVSLSEYFWDKKRVEDKDLAALMIWIGRYYNDVADYFGALEWYGKALVIRERVLGREHPDTATMYNNVALVYDSLGRFEEALEWYSKALIILEKVLGKNHPSTITVQENYESTLHKNTAANA